MITLVEDPASPTGWSLQHEGNIATNMTRVIMKQVIAGKLDQIVEEIKDGLRQYLAQFDQVH